MQAIVVLLGCLCLSPVWLKPAAEPRVTSRNAQDVLNIIEQTLTLVDSESQAESQFQNGVDLHKKMAPSKWPWIDSLLNLYVQSGTPPNISEGVVSIILQHYAINEDFRETVIREFTSSKAFINFTLQEYSVVKDGLLQWFVTSEDFRRNVLQDVPCSDVSKLLNLFASSMPVDTSSVDFAKEEPFAWQVLQKWSENDCFKSALLGRLVVSKPFKDRTEAFFSNSEAFSKAVVLGFISSQYFVRSLVTEYTKTDHLLNKLLHQFETTEVFRDYLLNILVKDESFRQAIFDFLSTVEFNANEDELKEVVLKQVIESSEFRKALFLQVQADSDFKKAVFDAFFTIQKFQSALVKVFAKSDCFKKKVSNSQGMLNDAMLLFENSESFSDAVLRITKVHSSEREGVAKRADDSSH